MMSPYKRANAICSDSWGGGGESQGNLNGGAEECHLFLVEFLKKRKLISINVSK